MRNRIGGILLGLTVGLYVGMGTGIVGGIFGGVRGAGVFAILGVIVGFFAAPDFARVWGSVRRFGRRN
ncbi:hypothetical protein CX676_04030 [Paracoccus zhejiangensis]|uniref:Uncharacterized protein n=1 Tax=Paracoccus zhejiangensis TaxID=1077935 RepID=A0A2H5EVV3_9RHOB|nr:hypothetical protein CX676_04030 [Paracoccus zhejiangensis]